MAQSIFAAPSNQNKPLLQFRAGKMLIRGNLVTPDTRKGQIQLIQSPEDSLLHFIWKDRTTGQVESDLIIMPDEATFKRVKQCTTGRVYLLEWKATGRKMFFWMQEPSEEKDNECEEKMNQYFNNPPAPAEAGGGSAGGAFGGLDQNTLMQMMGLGGRRGGPRGAASSAVPPERSRPAAAASSPSATSGQISQDQLQNVLSGLGIDLASRPASRPSSAAQPQPQQQQQGPPPAEEDLNAIINSDALLPLLEDPLIQAALFPHLPEGSRTPEELRQLVRSPQFQQSLAHFNAALQTGQLGGLMSHFGLPASVGGPEGGVGAFLRALQEQNQKGAQDRSQEQRQKTEEEGKPEEGEGGEKDDKGDSMDDSA